MHSNLLQMDAEWLSWRGSRRPVPSLYYAGSSNQLESLIRFPSSFERRLDHFIISYF